MVTAVSGIKWNLTDTWVVLANVKVLGTHGGLTTTVTPFIGVDYALGSIF